MKEKKFSLWAILFPIFLLGQLTFTAVPLSAAEQKGNITPILQLLLAHRGGVSSALNNGVYVVDSNSATNIVSVSEEENSGSSQLQVQGNMTGLQPGAIVNILPGADERFPFGMAGIVDTVTPGGGGATVELREASYADVINKAQIDLAEISLDASNLIGIIAPSAVQPSESAMAKNKQELGNSNVFSFRNGAIVVGNSASGSALPSVSKDMVNAGTVSLNVKTQLSEL